MCVCMLSFTSYATTTTTESELDRRMTTGKNTLLLIEEREGKAGGITITPTTHVIVHVHVVHR